MKVIDSLPVGGSDSLGSTMRLINGFDGTLNIA